MHWTYKPSSESDLEQGDILQRTEYLTTQVLNKYHPYYSEHPDNRLFIVLTQSCDLVKRSGGCKSDYITLAPVRPLRVIIEREFHTQLRNLKLNAQPYGSKRLKLSFSDFLSKLFNNNDPRYFFLKKQEDKQIAEDMCAITSLSISIKTEHYDECVKARALQLDDLFQAKLGWLVGQKFSRVGTPDWDETTLEGEIEQVISSTAVWIDDDLIPKVNSAIMEATAADPDCIIDGESLGKIISSIPAKKEQVITAFFDVLIADGVLAAGKDDVKFRLRKKLRNDPRFSQFF